MQLELETEDARWPLSFLGLCRTGLRQRPRIRDRTRFRHRTSNQTTETSQQQSDLFRALRGGSNNFGIVTRFVFRTFPQSRLWVGTPSFTPSRPRNQQLQPFSNFPSNPFYDPSASPIHSFGMKRRARLRFRQ